MQFRPLPFQQTAHKLEHFWNHKMCKTDLLKIFLALLGHSITTYEKMWSWICLDFSTDALDAFNMSQSKLIKSPVIALLQQHSPYVIRSDASSNASEAVLLHQKNQGKMKEGDENSNRIRKFNQKKQNYSVTARKCLALVWTIKSIQPSYKWTSLKVRTLRSALQ